MAVYSIFGQTGGGVLQADTTDYCMGVQFSLSQNAQLTGVRFYSASGATVLPGRCAIMAVTGQTVISGTEHDSPPWSGAAGTGWVKCPYNGAVTLNAATNYKAVVFYGGGSNWYSATSHYWDTGAGASGITSGIITAPNNAGANGGQDTYATPVTGITYPSSSFNAANYWVDVEVTVTTGVNSAALLSFFP